MGSGYGFSDAMKGANLTWDDATLDEFLTSPMKKVPGTKMTFAGLTDAAKRKDVIDYLKTLK
jgi:cytochrome c